MMFGKSQNGNQGASQAQNLQQTQTQTQNQTQTLKKEMPQKAEKKKEFHFSFDQEQDIDKELRKPRSRAYMEVFDAIDMLSATDEEIIAALKDNMDEETAEEFSNMSADEILEEIMATFHEEFEKMSVKIESIMQGVLARCYIEGCDCHGISPTGQIINHFPVKAPMPNEFFERGRKIFNHYPNCRCVEVYTDCCRIVNRDTTVMKLTNQEIDKI